MHDALIMTHDTHHQNHYLGLHIVATLFMIVIIARFNQIKVVSKIIKVSQHCSKFTDALCMLPFLVSCFRGLCPSMTTRKWSKIQEESQIPRWRLALYRYSLSHTMLYHKDIVWCLWDMVWTRGIGGDSLIVLRIFRSLRVTEQTVVQAAWLLSLVLTKGFTGA